MKKIYCAANLPDAHIVLHLLEDAGIEARVLNENAQGGLGELPFTHVYPEVWLMNERDFSRAREIVEAHEAPPYDLGSVRCGGCGEDNPRNFQICWQCGATL